MSTDRCSSVFSRLVRLFKEDLCLVNVFIVLGLFVLDFPMNEEGERRAQGDDARDCRDFTEITQHNGAQNLTAELKLQSHRHPFGEIEPGRRAALDVTDDSDHDGADDDDDPCKLEENDCNIDNYGKQAVKKIHMLSPFTPSTCHLTISVVFCQLISAIFVVFTAA